MKHATVVDLLPWFANETLDDRTRAEIERELMTCDSCAAEYASVRELQDVMQGVARSEIAPPPLVRDRVLSLVAATAQQPPQRSVRLRIPGLARVWQPVAALSLVVLIAVAGFEGIRRAEYVSRNGLFPGPDMPLGRVGKSVAQQVEPNPVFFGAAPPHSERPGAKLIRTGSISLIVSDVDSTMEAIRRLTTSADGYIRSLRDSAGSEPGTTRTLHVEIAVPQGRFDSTLAEVAALGKVSYRGIDAQDVTDQLVDDNARLRNLRHEEQDLIRIMDRSGKMSEILAVEGELSSVRDSIERLDAHIRSTSQQVEYSGITIDAQAERSATPVERSPLSHLENTWQLAVGAAGRALLSIVGLGVWALVFSPFVVAIGLLGYLVWRKLRT